MLNRISHTFLYVLDQDEAVDFYVGKLGMELSGDADLGNMRWLTVRFPDQPDLEVILMRPGQPIHDEATTEQLRELISKGAGSGLIFHTDDCVGTYERLKGLGVEFTQEPIERFYGIDCGLRDPSGNPIRITQPPEGPVVVPSKEELAAME